MKRGEIWLLEGRPFLIVSPEPFNRITKVPIVVPVTSARNFARAAGLAVALTGSKTKGIIRCDQPRALDLASRRGSKLESVPDAVMDEVLAKTPPICE